MPGMTGEPLGPPLYASKRRPETPRKYHKQPSYGLLCQGQVLKATDLSTHAVTPINLFSQRIGKESGNALAISSAAWYRV